MAIVAAANQVFSQYGVAKSTMSDVAKAAGVSRQTLYNMFPGKEELLRAGVRLLHAQSLQDMDQAVPDKADLAARIDAFYRIVPLKWYDLVQSNPGLADLLDGLHKIAKDEMQNGQRDWVRTLTTMIADGGGAVPPHKDADIAEFLYNSATSAKYAATDRNMLVRQLDILKASVLALVQPTRPRTDT